MNEMLFNKYVYLGKEMFFYELYKYIDQEKLYYLNFIKDLFVFKGKWLIKRL